MCGRYVILTDEEEREITDILEKINEKYGEDSIKTGEIFPTDIAPALMAENRTITPFPVKWGFPELERQRFNNKRKSRDCL